MFDSKWENINRDVKSLLRQVNKNPFDRSLRQKYYAKKKFRRKVLKQNVKHIRDNIVQNLNNLAEDDPKAYWNLIEELEKLHSDKPQPDDNISPEKWLIHFKNLMQSKNRELNEKQRDIEDGLSNHPNRSTFTELDFHITYEEIEKAIDQLKTRKSSGSDSIINEMLKSGKSIITPLLSKLFNIIYTIGIFPTKWADSMIKPLFKSGNKFDPANYRGISLTSCLGKLFCSILNTRLVSYLDKNEIYTPHQIAFRKNYRTSDHIFVLQTLINKYTSSKFRKKNETKSLYVCFVDLRKAFDTVWRGGLFHKMLNYGIGGKLYNVISDMYSKSSACIKLTNGNTSYFETDIGVKQGCVISPTLFNIFLNDIPNIFDTEKSGPVFIHEKLLNCLMYADDIALISSSEEGLQHCLDKLDKYCNEWKLSVNCKKTKVIIFNKSGKIIKNNGFYMGKNSIEVVKEMKYLGIVFNNNCTFNTAVDNLKDKGIKSMFKLFKSFGNYTPDMKTSFRLFDAMIKPILLYNCEVWGPYMCNFDKLSEIAPGKSQLFYKNSFEKVHMKWLKYTLGVNSKCTNIAATAETGRYPLLLDIICTTMKYWFRMSNAPENTLLYHGYKANIDCISKGQKCWLSFIEKVANKSNFHSESHVNAASIKTKQYLQGLFDKQFECDLYNDMRNSGEGNKLRTFRTFKNDISEEPYLSCILDRKVRHSISRLRMSAHNLKIETGRHSRPKTLLNNRICSNCPGKIDNEFHLVAECSKIRIHSDILFKQASNIIPNFNLICKQRQFEYILKLDNIEIIEIFSTFIKNVVKERGSL